MTVEELEAYVEKTGQMHIKMTRDSLERFLIDYRENQPSVGTVYQFNVYSMLKYLSMDSHFMDFLLPNIIDRVRVSLHR